jgi:hypothetical protein
LYAQAIFDTNTNASIYLTIYTSSTMAAIADSDLDDLGTQLAQYQANGRAAFLRFLPEMNGQCSFFTVSPISTKESNTGALQATGSTMASLDIKVYLSRVRY